MKVFNNKCYRCRKEATVVIRSTVTSLNDHWEPGYSEYKFCCRKCAILSINEYWIETKISLKQAIAEIDCKEILES